MPDLVIHTIDGRRNIWRNVNTSLEDLFSKATPDSFIRHNDDEPVIRVGAIVSIDVKEGKE